MRFRQITLFIFALNGECKQFTRRFSWDIDLLKPKHNLMLNSFSFPVIVFLTWCCNAANTSTNLCQLTMLGVEIWARIWVCTTIVTAGCLGLRAQVFPSQTTTGEGVYYCLDLKLTMVLGQQTSRPPIPIHEEVESAPVWASLFRWRLRTCGGRQGQWVPTCPEQRPGFHTAENKSGENCDHSFTPGWNGITLGKGTSPFPHRRWSFLLRSC